MPARPRWLELSVRVPRQHAPLVESLLDNEAVLALTLEDDADDPVLEPGVGETPLWPSLRVTALLEGDTPVGPLARTLSLVPGVDRPQQVTLRRFEDRQWERVWLERFGPMRFGRGLWIVPGQQQAPADAEVVLRLDPGLAFGTGTHPTTRLCLQWIDRHDFEGRTVIDYGCGSGVLGIAAALKGAAAVVCVDNDPQALSAAMANARANEVDGRLKVTTPADFGTQAADVVLANILAGPLVELAPRLLGSLRPGGSLVLSGLLEDQVAEVSAAYAPCLGPVSTATDGGWARLHGRAQRTGCSG